MEHERENPLRAEKRKKLTALREKGLNPFPHNYRIEECRIPSENILSS